MGASLDQSLTHLFTAHGPPLVLKTDNRDGDVNVAQQIAAMGLPRNAPKIVLLYNQELPGYQLGSLYRAADCFVPIRRPQAAARATSPAASGPWTSSTR